MVVDSVQREEAIDCTRSFIVQAPAGSGKTELLIQRYLALLAQVEKIPEQIIAITFTRKAAQEMRTRIVQALQRAANEAEPSMPHLQKTWCLARKVLLRDKQEGWQLLQNPNRFAVQTIDSFCASIVAKMPLLSRLGVMPELIEDASSYYAKALEQIGLTLDQESQWKKPIKNLLRHLDNQWPKLQELLVDLLSRREQWLDYVGYAQNTENFSTILQHNLEHLIEDSLANANAEFPDHLKKEAFALMKFAQHYCVKKNISNPLTALEAIKDFPLMTLNYQPHWQAFAHLLLTKEGELRKTVNKTAGFPAKTEGETKEEKEEFDYHKKNMLGFLEKTRDIPSFLRALALVQKLPSAHYAAEKKQILLDLLEVLALAVAQLMVLFQEKGVIDFNQLLYSALQALGALNEPSDLCLALDYKIQHILVDEFQDTSVAQFRLLERLTQAWEPDDGRTLFLVGDPMQSIYRFRQAEVGLFLKAWQQGLGNIALKPLTLRVNFRSTPEIVAWINQHLSAAFPDYADMGVGAVPFVQAVSMPCTLPSTITARASKDAMSEATDIVKQIETALQDPEQKEIAILVQKRSQLVDILPALQAANIEYCAIDIEKYRPVLQDLVVLTRALLHPADRLAWLALLRAPWCGLSLVDITHMVQQTPDACVWDMLQAYETATLLSANAQAALATCMPIWRKSLEERERLPVCQWVFETWIALEGPAYYPDVTLYEDVTLFCNELEKIGRDAYYFTPEEWEQRQASWRTTAIATEARVQIMTMHKAKGLEFDTVIIPSLQAGQRSNTRSLLSWWERPRHHGKTELLITPLQASHEEEDKLYRYIRDHQQKAFDLELTRLLYVAVTRAKTHLHLSYILNLESNPEISPPSNSLLKKIWPTLHDSLI